MKYLKIVLTLVLLVAFVFATAGAATKAKTSARLQMPKALVGKITAKQWQELQQEMATPEKQERDPDQPYSPVVPVPRVDAARIAKTALSGDINVGTGAAAGYTSINAAFHTLQSSTLTGAVRLLLTDAVYAESSAVTLTAVPGSSLANTITIRPATGNLSCVVKGPVNNTDNGFFIVKDMVGVTIEGTTDGNAPGFNRALTIRFDETAAVPTNRFAGALRLIRDQNLTVQDAIVLGRFNGAKTLSYDAISLNGGTTRALTFNNCTINNCVLTHGRYGIDISSASPFPLDSNWTITNNQIGGGFAGLAGLAAGDYTDSLTNNGIITGDIKNSDISHNHIDGLRMPAALTQEATTNTRRLNGIYATFTNSTKVHDNVINEVYWANPASTLASGGRTYGIQVGGNLPTADPGGNQIYNNMVTHIHSDRAFAAATTYGLIGIATFFDHGIKIWHNSVWLSDSTAKNSRGHGILIAGGATQNGSNADVENNAVKMTVIPRAPIVDVFACFTDADIAPFAVPNIGADDHNDWYHDANSQTEFDFYSGSSTLYSWYSNSGPVFGTTYGAFDVEGNPNFTSATNLHIAAGPSWTFKIGASLGIATDIEGDAQTSPPSAGADVPATGATDLYAVSVAGGYLHGTAAGSPVTIAVKIKNNGGTTAAGNLHVVTSDGYDQTQPISVGALLNTTIAMGVPWTPATTGSFYQTTITASADAAGDNLLTNDTATNAEPVYPVFPGTKYTTSFETNAERNGWFGTGDWVAGSGFVKLGGAHTGNYAYVTKLTGLYTSNQNNYLFSPYFDFTNNPTPKIEFYHSMRTEPSYDASNLQYTTDLGVSWHIVGTLNDPNGQNWYGGVYANAAGDASCYFNPLGDDGTSFPDPDNGAAFGPKWTSNGDCNGADTHTGPDGYVFVQRVSADMGGKPLVQFRYVASADPASADSGWAFDDFAIHPATIVSGTVWNDVNGDGFHQNTEPGISGATVTSNGPNIASTLTDVNGHYSLALLNGQDTLTVTGPPGTFSTPSSYIFNVIKNPGIPYVFDFGYFNPAEVTGTVYHDVNHNGTRDLGEPGIGNVTINVSGAASATGVTAPNGFFDIFVDINGAGVCNVSQVVPAGYLQFTPGGPYSPGLAKGVVVNNLDFGDAASAVGQSYRTASYEDWAFAKDAAGKYKAIKCKPNQVQFKFNLIAPADNPTLTVSWKSAFAKVYKGKNKLPGDSIANFTLGNGGTVVLTGILQGDEIQFDGMQVPGKSRVKIKYGWGAKVTTTVEVYKMNAPRLPMPNLHNVGEELFAQILQPVFGALGKVKMTAYKSVQKSMNASGTGHSGGNTCLGFITKPVDAVKPDKHQNRLWAEQLTLIMNVLASDFGKFPPGFGDLIYDDQQNPNDPWNGLSIRDIIAKCDTFLACIDTPKGSDGNVYQTVLNRLNHDSFRDSTNYDTSGWSCQKITITGSRPLSQVPWLQANPGAAPRVVPIARDLGKFYQTPEKYALRQNFPNPFNPSTTITFDLPSGGIVSLKVYNVLGQEVATIYDNVAMESGVQDVQFDASNLSSGIYFYRLTARATDDDGAVTSQTFTQVKKMLLMK